MNRQNTKYSLPEKQKSDTSLLNKLITGEALENGGLSAADQNAIPERGVQFLLTEYNALTDLWKHTDARFESGLNIFLTASALVVSSIVFFSQYLSDTRLFLSITMFASTSLLVTGVVLSRRILAAAFSKAEYIFARDIIRNFFAEAVPEISTGLYYLTKNFKSKQEPIISVKIPMPRSLLLVLHILNSFLAWVSTAIGIWLLNSHVQYVWIYGPSLFIAVVLFVFQRADMSNNINKFLKDKPFLRI